ncbi:hypothetical protein [Clostridioides sp. GD02376]|uniref:hypothetical protein n=1 Tax=Clostridioides sp. GD02376 TaxID=3054352 RepID=UPI0038A9C10E
MHLIDYFNLNFIDLTDKLLLDSLESKLKKYIHSYYEENIKLINDDYYDMYKTYFNILNSSFYAKRNNSTQLSFVTSLADKCINNVSRLLPIYDIEIIYSLKVKGFYISLIYKKGLFVDCNTKFKNIYHALMAYLSDIIPNNIKNTQNILTINGYVTISNAKLKKIKDKNKNIDNPADAIIYVLRNNIRNYLNFVVDNIAEINTFYETEVFCTCNGFEMPCFLALKTNRDTFIEGIKDVLSIFQKKASYYNYQSDGVFIKSNDIKGSATLNFLLKMDYWKVKSYVAIIKDVFWCYSKKGIVPIAEIQPLIIDEDLVRYINLYSPSNILMLDIHKDDFISFLYIDNSIIIPVTKDGQLLFCTTY